MYSEHRLKVMASMLEYACVADALVSEQALDQLAYGVVGVWADGALTFCNKTAETQFAALIAEEVLTGRLRDAGKRAVLTATSPPVARRACANSSSVVAPPPCSRLSFGWPMTPAARSGAADFTTCIEPRASSCCAPGASGQAHLRAS